MGLELSRTYEFHYRKRYGLAPNDPLFLEATFEECVIDWWAHRHAEDPELHKKATSEEHSAELDAMEAEANQRMAEALSRRLGRHVPADPESLMRATEEAAKAAEAAAKADTEEVFSWRGR